MPEEVGAGEEERCAVAGEARLSPLAPLLTASLALAPVWEVGGVVFNMVERSMRVVGY